MNARDPFGNSRGCRGCGCTEYNACMIASPDGPIGCAWVLLDLETPTGVCSACAIRMGWSQDGLEPGRAAARRLRHVGRRRSGDDGGIRSRRRVPRAAHANAGAAVKITIENTEKLVTLVINGHDVPARVWQGATESGIPVQCFITRIAPEIPRIDERTAQFERELMRCADARPSVDVIPLRMIL